MSGIVRVKKKRNPYVCIDKFPLEDERLSWKARGILAFLLSKPDDWVVSMVNLERASKQDGRRAVQTAVKELEQNGYVVRSRVKNDKGCFVGWETTIFETPEDAAQSDLTPTDHKTPVGEKRCVLQNTTDKPVSRRRRNRPTETAQSIVSNKDPVINDQEKSPLTPLSGEPDKDRGEDSLRCEEESGGKQESSVLSKQNTEASLKTKDPVVDQNSAAPPPPVEKPKPRSPNGVAAAGDVARMMLIGMKPVVSDDSAMDLHPWQLSDEPNHFDAEFVEEIRTQHLPTCTKYRGREVTPADARSWITRRQHEPDELAQVQARWDDFDAKRKVKAAPQPTESQQPVVPNFRSWVTGKHQAWLDFRLEIGEAAFTAKYSWHQEWLDYLANVRLYHKILTKFNESRSVIA